MNVMKNMEAIFIVAVALVAGTGFATASNAPARIDPPAAAAQAAEANVAVVTVSAKRLSAAEKAAM